MAIIIAALVMLSGYILMYKLASTNLHVEYDEEDNVTIHD